MINFADEIKSKITMRDVCGMYGIKVNRASKAICPFHNDTHESMHVYDNQRGWYCFTCGDGGDVIKFAQRYFDLNFQDACAKLNNDFCLGLPIGKRLSLRELREAEQAARERKRKLKSEKAEHDRLLEDYNSLLDRYVGLDKMRIQYAPDRVSGDINDLYAQAVKDIPIIEDALTEAEMRLYVHEHNRPRDS